MPPTARPTMSRRGGTLTPPPLPPGPIPPPPPAARSCTRRTKSVNAAGASPGCDCTASPARSLTENRTSRFAPARKCQPTTTPSTPCAPIRSFERLQHRDGVAGRVGQDGDADLLARARDLPLQPADVEPRGVSAAGAANTA
jgi:hypothetical protein